MNEVDWLKSLDRPASPAPTVEVTAGVMRAVRSLAPDDDRVLPIAAAVAALLGIAAAAIAVPAWLAPSEPFAGFGDALNLVLR